MLDNFLGLKIRNARRDKRMTIKELATITGLTDSQICRIERGKTKKPYYSTLKKIEDALHIDLSMDMEEFGYISNINPKCLNQEVTGDYIFNAANWLSFTPYSLADKQMVLRLLERLPDLSKKDKELINVILG